MRVNAVRANSHTLHDRIEADAEAWRHYLQPMINQAIYDEATGRKGSRAALARALRDALDAVGGYDE